MILEEASFEAFGYYPKDLKQQSNKKILAACDNCGKVRVTPKFEYRSLCKSCAQKGNKHHNYGKRGKDTPGYKNGFRTDFPKEYMHLYHKKYTKTKSGKNNISKNNARRRNLGFIAINSHFEGSEGHHITHNFIIYIPKFIHRSVYHNLNTKKNMKKINTFVLNFLLEGF